MRRLLFLLSVWLFFIPAHGQLSRKMGSHALSCPVCYGSGKVEKSFTPPPPEIMHSLKSAEKRSEFIVDYSLFPEEAKSAFAYAVNIWEHLIDSPVPIRVLANWRRQDEGVLGSCYPYTFEKNFPGAPRKDIYYPIALAEKLLGEEITGMSQPDIAATFNREINWYFGTDGDTPDQMYDFVSVVLHELGHGLGFFGFFSVSNNTGSYDFYELGDATVYDLMVEQANGERLLDRSKYPNPSQSLKDALVSGWLYADSPVAIQDGDGFRPRLFAPSSWNGGSSIYHLNEASYSALSNNSLMTPFLGRGEAIHNPGSLTMGMMADMGWKTMQIDLKPIKDQEVLSIVNVSVSVRSDYDVDTTQIFFIYSSDDFSVVSDTLVLKNQENGRFEALWTPLPGVSQIQYYISSGDVKGRVFRYPQEAPFEFLTLNIGPDNISPVITHEAINFYLDAGNRLSFEVLAEDNLGIDTVYVIYSLNGAEEKRFGLEPRTDNLYSALFPLDSDQLRQGDVISYRIIAVDASVAGNTSTTPASGMYSIQVEKAAEPVYSYSNDFNGGSQDFVLADFRIITERGFTNGALHSPHPYMSPEFDGGEFNFITILKVPVVLVEGSIMSFDEIVLVEPGSSGTVFGDSEFWDYVIVEGSKDRGDSWLPLIDGYDSRANNSWDKAYTEGISGNNSRSTGSADQFVNRRIDFLENGNFLPGDTLLIRFRLFSDPYAYGWGWVIDNLIIQSIVSSQPTSLLSAGNFHLYPNPFDQVFSVDVDAGAGIDRLELELFNIYGQRVWGETLLNVFGLTSVDVEIERAPGVYLFVARENGVRVLSRKIISR